MKKGHNKEIEVSDINDAITFFKEGGWIENDIPNKFHFVEVDDYCECCGEYLGKTKEMIVDEYKVERRYIKPGSYNPHNILISPEMCINLFGDKI